MIDLKMRHGMANVISNLIAKAGEDLAGMSIGNNMYDGEGESIVVLHIGKAMQERVYIYANGDVVNGADKAAGATDAVTQVIKAMVDNGYACRLATDHPAGSHYAKVSAAPAAGNSKTSSSDSNDRIKAAKNIIAKIVQYRADNDIRKTAEFKIWAKGGHVRIYTDNAKHGYIDIDKDGNMIAPLYKTAHSDLYSYAAAVSE